MSSDKPSPDGVAEPVGRRAAELYRSAIVVDATAPIGPASAIEVPSSPDERVGAHALSGVTLAVFTVVDDFPNSIEQTMKLVAESRRFVLDRSDRYLIVERSEDVWRAKADGRMAIGFAFQGSNALLGDLGLVESYRRLGVIQMLLAYNIGNLAADGCHEKRNAGLTRFGRDLVREMNRVGMIVDVSHMGRASTKEAIEVTTKPPIFSHSTPARFARHERNVDDDEIRACAAKEGLVCLTGVGIFIDGEDGKVSVGRLAETIDHVVQLVGPRHAGLGLDYILDASAMARYVRGNAALYADGDQYPADGKVDFLSPGHLPELTEALIARGYSDDHVRMILGENYMRVLAANID